MARVSEETLSTRSGRPLALARYISPSNSSRTGQKSFSKASRLENIANSPCAEDAAQFSNERLTTRISSVPVVLPVTAESDRHCPVIRDPAGADRMRLLAPPPGRRSYACCLTRCAQASPEQYWLAGSVRRHEDR